MRENLIGTITPGDIVFNSKIYSDMERLNHVVGELERKYPTITWEHKTTVILDTSKTLLELRNATGYIVGVGLASEELAKAFEQTAQAFDSYRRSLVVLDDDSRFEIVTLNLLARLATRFYLWTIFDLDGWPGPLSSPLRSLARKLAGWLD